METQMRTSKSLLTQLLCLEHYSNEIRSTPSRTIIILSPSPFSSHSYWWKMGSFKINKSSDTKKFLNCFFHEYASVWFGILKTLGLVWFTILNKYFQFLINITCISTYRTYFQKKLKIIVKLVLNGPSVITF